MATEKTCPECDGTGRVKEQWAPPDLEGALPIEFDSVCPDCGGTGYENDDDRCERCGQVLGVDSGHHELGDQYVCTDCFSGAVDDAHERYKDSFYDD